MSGENFSDLKNKCVQLGFFEYSSMDLFKDMTIIFSLFITSYLLRSQYPAMAFLIASISNINLLWWIHNSGHDSFFKSKEDSKMVIESLGILFMGMPQIEYHYEVHRLHHAYTNIIGKDKALDTRPVIWNPRQLSADRRNSWFLSIQSYFWFFFVLPMVWPLITFRSVYTLLERKKYIRIFLFLLRWILVLWLFNFDLFFILVPTLIAGFILGFVGSLNHFHMPMDTKKMANFPLNVFLVTQNLEHNSSFSTWLTGGLNYHIEHHLFPTMPSKNLKLAAPLVQEYARNHGFPYHICSALEATKKLAYQLNHPLEEKPSHEFALDGGL